MLQFQKPDASDIAVFHIRQWNLDSLPLEFGYGGEIINEIIERVIGVLQQHVNSLIGNVWRNR